MCQANEKQKRKKKRFLLPCAYLRLVPRDKVLSFIRFDTYERVCVPSASQARSWTRVTPTVGLSCGFLCVRRREANSDEAKQRRRVVAVPRQGAPQLDQWGLSLALHFMPFLSLCRFLGLLLKGLRCSVFYRECGK